MFCLLLFLSSPLLDNNSLNNPFFGEFAGLPTFNGQVIFTIFTVISTYGFLGSMIRRASIHGSVKPGGGRMGFCWIFWYGKQAYSKHAPRTNDTNISCSSRSLTIHLPIKSFVWPCTCLANKSSATSSELLR